MTGKLGDLARLLHILEAIKEIREYTLNAKFKTFKADSMMRNASIRQLEIIGEACNRLDEKLREENSDIPWREIIGLRNILIHQYFEVDAKIIWDVIKKDLKKL